jgi:hypothetical protein
MIKFEELKPKLELPEKKVAVEKLRDETFQIVKPATINKSRYHEGEYAIVICKKGKEDFYFTTSSEVLIKQLKEVINPAIEKNGEPVEVTLRKPKGKRYYTFE